MSCFLRFDPIGNCLWAVRRDGVAVAKLARKDNGLVVMRSTGPLSTLETMGLVEFMSTHRCSKCKRAHDAECTPRTRNTRREDSVRWLETLYRLEDPRAPRN